jgi:glycosyltransferase involved in cell wall biosynthesis
VTTQPLVSIVIPALNAAPWIGETIESCLNQTWKNFEVIVVDNGSTDGTQDVVRSLGPSGIKLFECTRPGASAARNVGTARSKGAYIQYLDADDLLGPSKIEIQVSRLLECDEDTVASGSWVRFEKDPNEREVSPEAVWQDLEPDAFLIRSWSGGGMMPIFGWLTPRSVIDRAGTWDESLTVNDDGEFFTRAILQSSHIRFCPDAMGYYRTAPVSSLSKGTSREAWNSYFVSVDLCARHLLAIRNDAEARRGCAYLVQEFAYAAYPYEPDLSEEAERMVTAWGGCDLAPPGGRLFRLLSSVIGWKQATRLRQVVNH